MNSTVRVADDFWGSSPHPAESSRLYILGIRRCGIHAAVYWSIPQLEGMVCFVNDPVFDGDGACKARERTRLYYSARGKAWPLMCQSHLAIYESEARTRAVTLIPEKFPLLVRPLVSCLVRKVHRWRARLGYASKDPFFMEQTPMIPMRKIVAVENLAPGAFAEVVEGWERESSGLDENGQDSAIARTVMIVMRDPWNHLASLLKSPQPEPPHPLDCEGFQARWVEYAREYTGRTRLLAGVGRMVRFNYRRWFSDLDYRRDISAELGCVHSDYGLNAVSDFGGGSSFDGCQFHQRAQAMNVLERWRAYADHPLMRRLCNDGEIRALSREIFDEEPPLSEASKTAVGRPVPLVQPHAA